MNSNKEILGLHRITKEHLKDLCKKHRLYQTPHLNDQLYLHYQGFQAIENLDEYTGLKCLWLESNAISEIQGLDCLRELKCLFLQNNLIRKIEHLDGCSGLDTLNLASNHITKIENCGVDVLPVLSTLNLSRNQLQSSDGLKELVNCSSLWSLDLSHNRIDDILAVKIFASIPELRVLVLQGNPVVNRVPQYRKTLILECKNLTYLDSRPVFPKDRVCAEAWKRGGYEEERKEHDRWNRKDRRKIRDSVNATLRLRRTNGDQEVQLIASTDDEEEEENGRELEANQSASADLEITGMKADDDDVALEMKGDGVDEPKSSSLDDAFPSSLARNHDVLEWQDGSQVVVTCGRSPANEVIQDSVQESGDNGVGEQPEVGEAPTLIEHVCEEEELITERLTRGPAIKAPSTEHSAANSNSGTSSSSSEMSSESDDTDESEGECDDEDDSRFIDCEAKGIEEDNQSASVPQQQHESDEEEDNAEMEPQGWGNPDADCHNSMSFDELVASQSEQRSKQATQDATRTTQIDADETIPMSDEEDSGLFNSLQTASSFSELDDATLTCETPTNPGSTESPSLDTSSDETLCPEPEKHSVNPEDIEIPDDVEVNSWLTNFLAGLKAEQDRDDDDASSLTDSSAEEHSDDDVDDGTSTTPAQAASIAEADEDKPEKEENSLDAAAAGEIWLKSVLTSPSTEGGLPKTEAAEECPQSKGPSEATDLLASILAEAYLKIDETTLHESSDDDGDDSPGGPAFSSTLLDGLDSFNKVVEMINKRREERAQKINDFVNHPLTKEDAPQTGAQLDQQIEQIKQERHERVRQLVEHVYAQRDEYDDTLEVIEGRLMVVKRGTGALEEVQPTQASSGYVSHGVSTNSLNQGVSATPRGVMADPHSSCGVSTAKSSLNGSESDDYATPLSDDEDVEQHQSDTKISKITFPSTVNDVDSLQASATRTSMCGQDEVSFEKDFREEQEESLQRVMQLHRNIDADVFAEVTKWMDVGGDIPSVSPAVKKRMGREEIMLLKQQVATDDDALEGVAGIFDE